MRIKIAIIGSEHFCSHVLQLVKENDDMAIECHIYDEPQEAATIIQTIKPCDAIVFSGSLPYLYAQKAVQQFAVPAIFLQQDETAISTTLLYVLANEQLPCDRISIDVTNRFYVDHVIEDVNGTIALPFIHELQEDDTIATLVSFHSKLMDEGKTAIAITSVHAVYEQLKAVGKRACMMIDPGSSIVRSLYEARQQAMLQQSTSAQIAVGIVTAPDPSMQDFIATLAQQLHAHWHESAGEYTLFTTMGNLEYSIKNPQFTALVNQLPSTVKIAFGCGESTMIAADHARLALNFNRSTDLRGFYILDAHKKLHGPFPQTEDVLDMKVDHPTLLSMADKTKLGPANISKLLAFNKSRSTNQFTANDLAIYLNVSRRTAERTIKKLIEYDYITIVGEEMTYKQGRPRAIYEFNFPTHM
ncbi:HTH domain-containing protein [Sporosarcina sp. ITBMC105]